MNLSTQLSDRLKSVYFGNNWTNTNLEKILSSIDWKTAMSKIGAHNDIASLTYHINYYLKAISKVLEGHALEASDSLSFDMPAITNDRMWMELKQQAFSDARHIIDLVADQDESIWSEIFVESKYGNTYHNLLGLTEHIYYHFGQIVLLNKLINEDLDKKDPENS